MSAGELDQVRTAHTAFYRAFESLELARMDEAWDHEGQVTCAHPGWPLAEGWAAVRGSWETLFANTSEIRFEIADARIEVRGELAWVVCVERISSGGAGGAVLATNVLRRCGDGRWRMVHHHGSPFSPPREPRRPPPAGGKVLN